MMVLIILDKLLVAVTSGGEYRSEKDDSGCQNDDDSKSVNKIRRKLGENMQKKCFTPCFNIELFAQK